MLHRFALADVPLTPWKNGGGSTREIVCRPQGADMHSFDWRISLASIDQDGPFSTYAGVDRCLVLLDGDGIVLNASGAGWQHRLDRPLQPFAFSGDEAVSSTLLGDRSIDFNVMTRRGVMAADVRVLRNAATRAAAPAGLLLVTHGTWQALGGGDVTPLHAGQGLWWDGTPHAWQLRPQQDGSSLLWVGVTPLG